MSHVKRSEGGRRPTERSVYIKFFEPQCPHFFFNFGCFFFFIFAYCAMHIKSSLGKDSIIRERLGRKRGKSGKSPVGSRSYLRKERAQAKAKRTMTTHDVGCSPTKYRLGKDKKSASSSAACACFHSN